MKEVIRSVSDDQREILSNIAYLNGIETFDVDLTYGNGSFYKGMAEPVHKFDIDPTRGVTVASSCTVPLDSESVGSVVFDPPFLTYVRAGRDGNGDMVMSRRFSGYWTYTELEDHYRATLREAYRILRPGGIMVFKCQDIIHNHRMHCTHVNVLEWGRHMFALQDLFVLTAKHRMPSPNRRGTQKHARIHHCYFLVLVKQHP